MAPPGLRKPRRLPADRFRRVWGIVEYVAGHPGCTRRELAAAFALSERQLQDDLGLIRRDFGLPLVRQRGYRFAEEVTPDTLRLSDWMTLRGAFDALAERDTAPAAIASLVDRLIGSLPVQARALARHALATVAGAPSDDARDHALRLIAMAQRDAQALDLQLQPRLGGPAERLLLEPELVLALRGGLFLLGYCRDQRKLLMLDLDAVIHVQPALPAPESTSEAAPR